MQSCRAWRSLCPAVEAAPQRQHISHFQKFAPRARRYKYTPRPHAALFSIPEPPHVANNPAVLIDHSPETLQPRKLLLQNLLTCRYKIQGTYVIMSCQQQLNSRLGLMHSRHQFQLKRLKKTASSHSQSTRTNAALVISPEKMNTK